MMRLIRNWCGGCRVWFAPHWTRLSELAFAAIKGNPKQMRQNRTGLCAFCGEAGVTDEHIIADWIKRLLPVETKHHRFRGAKSAEGSSNKTGLRQLQGSAFTAKTRKVCARCNSGWMSELEELARPLLTPLIHGETLTLQPEDQAVLAGWIAKTVMTADTLYLESSAITECDRRTVRATFRPPDNWSIWLALHHNSDWRTGLDHIGSALHREADYERNKNVVSTQSTTIGIGNLLIHAFSSALPGFQFEPSAAFGACLHRIWPSPGRILLWPPINACYSACNFDPLSRGIGVQN
jgi:hypothetical protein